MSEVEPPNSTGSIEALMRASYPRILDYFYRHPVFAAILYMIILFVAGISNALVFGHYYSTSIVIGLVEDKVYIFGIFFLGLAVFYYFRIPVWLGNAFDSMRDNNIFAESEIKISPRVLKVFTSRWLYLVKYIIFLVVVIIWIITTLAGPEKLWWEVNTLSFIIMVIIWSVAFFAAIGVVLNYLSSIYIIRVILKDNKTVVYSLHPDKAGGWSPLGSFSLKFNYLVLAYGVILVIWVLDSINYNIRNDYGLIIQLILYIILAPTIFYLPLHSVHKIMMKYRNKLISETSTQYYKEHLKAQGEIKKNYMRKLEGSLKRMDLLQKLQKQESDYPTWPFNLRMRFNVIINTIIPIILAIIGLVIDILV